MTETPEPYVGENTESHYTRCIRLGKKAMDEGKPVSAREWFEAAEAAAHAANALIPPAQPFQGGNWLPTPQQQFPSVQWSQPPKMADCGCPTPGICNSTACPRAMTVTS